MKLSEHSKILENELGMNEKQHFNRIISEEPEQNRNNIWRNLIEQTNPKDLRNAFHLDYVFQTKGESQSHENKKIAVIAHINYKDIIDRCLQYIWQIPSYIDIYINTKGEENIRILTDKIKQRGIKNVKLTVPKDRGREISGLLVACNDILMKYEYLCFVHDKKSNNGCPIKTVGQSFCDILWENSIKNAVYIENIISKFEEEPNLGLLSPPAPYMSKYLMSEASSWIGNLEKTIKLAEMLSINADISALNYPFTFGTVFWCRTKALKPLFKYNWQYEDFDPEPMATDNTISHAVERIFSYVTQSEGYYSGIMMTDEYASVYICNYQYMLEKSVDNIIFQDFFNHETKMFSDIQDKDKNFIENCSKYSAVYIYGAGNIGRQCLKFLNDNKIEVKAFVVSDNHKTNDFINEIPVIELKDLNISDKDCIVVAVGHDFLYDVYHSLKKNNINKNIIRYTVNFIEVFI